MSQAHETVRQKNICLDFITEPQCKKVEENLHLRLLTLYNFLCFLTQSFLKDKISQAVVTLAYITGDNGNNEARLLVKSHRGPCGEKVHFPQFNKHSFRSI